MYINSGNSVLVDILAGRQKERLVAGRKHKKKRLKEIKAVSDADLILKPSEPRNGRNISKAVWFWFWL